VDSLFFPVFYLTENVKCFRGTAPQLPVKSSMDAEARRTWWEVSVFHWDWKYAPLLAGYMSFGSVAEGRANPSLFWQVLPLEIFRSFF